MTPPILSLQNGVGNEEALAAALGSANVLAGVITTPVSVLGPGAIQVDKPAYTLGLSPWHADVPASLVDATQSALTEAGFNVKRFAAAQSMKWTKLLMNMVGNAACAILDMTPAQKWPRTCRRLEIDAHAKPDVMWPRIHRQPGGYPFRRWPLIRMPPGLPAAPCVRRRRGGKSQVCIDLHSGRKGTVACQTAQSKRGIGVRTPINRMLTDVLFGMIDDGDVGWRHNHAAYCCRR